MVFDGATDTTSRLGDLCVGQSVRDQAHDLPSATGEPGWVLPRQLVGAAGDLGDAEVAEPDASQPGERPRADGRPVRSWRPVRRPGPGSGRAPTRARTGTPRRARGPPLRATARLPAPRTGARRRSGRPGARSRRANRRARLRRPRRRASSPQHAPPPPAQESRRARRVATPLRPAPRQQARPIAHPPGPPRAPHARSSNSSYLPATPRRTRDRPSTIIARHRSPGCASTATGPPGLLPMRALELQCRLQHRQVPEEEEALGVFRRSRGPPAANIPPRPAGSFRGSVRPGWHTPGTPHPYRRRRPPPA